MNFKNALLTACSNIHINYQAKKILRVRLTNKCNAKCVFCHGENGSNSPPFIFITLNHLSKALKHFDQDIASIALSGGEPFLHPQFFEIAKLCKTIVGSKVHVNTNAQYLTLDNIESIINAGIENFHINLNTLNHKIYKRDYGISFPRNLPAILDRIINFGSKATINFVFTKDKTKNDIIKMLSYCRQNNCSLTIINEYHPSPPFSGLLFQARMYETLSTFNYIIDSISPGRIVYRNNKSTICIAAPCAPALAWNGGASDNAIVLHENGNFTGFIHEF